MIIKRVAPYSAACCLGLIFFFLGFLMAAYFFAMIVEVKDGRFLSAPTGILIFIIAPPVYGIIGFVFGLILAFLYNLTAGWYGGLIIETESESKTFNPNKAFGKEAEKVIFIKEPE
ncbi:MAG: hypothetical protein ACKO81_04415 [Planctomycetota bacterium]